MQRFEQAWRLVWTGMAFVLFGVGGLILTATVFPLINLLIADREKRAIVAQRLVHWAFRLHVFYMTLFGVIGVTMIGVEKLENDRGVLVVANHPSLLDVVLLIAAMKRAQCIVKYQIWGNPFMRGVVSAADYIRNDGDPEKLLEDCGAKLARGQNIVIFPEGSRTVPGVPMKLQRGVANIAVRLGAPIRLITIDCVPPSLMKGQKWYQIPTVKSQFTITVHGLIDISRFMSDSNSSVAARHLNTYLAEQLNGGTRAENA
ncbi:MAG: lysophospholipid acyltransferase family protein [Parvibaculum sp.]|nr:lysophospholipid acyltransferase family protein [Parvibaculum sp.]